MKIDLSRYKSREDRFKFMAENHDILIAEKKFEMKKADAVCFLTRTIGLDGEVVKATAGNINDLLAKDTLTVEVVINTAGYMDSCSDVHIAGLWKKTLRENKNLLHLQEHVSQFDHVISDHVKGFTQEMSWRELGYNADGNTEALIFRSEIDKARNPFMFNQYARGFVKNHSVGMRYVKLFMCLDSEDSDLSQYKENWDKYIDSVVNRKEAEDQGYFWAVTEAKAFEGSSVVMGANSVTPTISVKQEPSQDTQNTNTEPPEGTQKSLFSKFSNLKS
jgi:hypothetical protein